MFVCWCMYVNQKDSFPIPFHLLSQTFQTLTNSVPTSNALLFVPCFYIVLCSALEAQYFLTFFSSLTSSKVKMKPVTHSVDTLVVCGNVRVTIAQNREG